MNRLSWFANRIRGLQPALDGKADVVHSHVVADITDLPAISKSAVGDGIVQGNATGKINDSWLPTYLAKLNSAGTFTKPQVFSTDTASTVPFTVQGAASQTGNLIDLKNSAGTILLSLDSVGRFATPISIFPNGNGTGVHLLTDANGVTIGNTGAGGIAYRFVPTNDSSGIGGGTLALYSGTTVMFAIRHYAQRVGIGPGMYNPQATLHSIGSTILGTATSAVSDASLGNGQMNPYLDEAGSNFKIKIKTSTGAIKTVTLAMV